MAKQPKISMMMANIQNNLKSNKVTYSNYMKSKMQPENIDSGKVSKERDLEFAKSITKA